MHAATHYQQLKLSQVCDPVPINGRIKLIDCWLHVMHSQMEDYASYFTITIAIGQNVAGIYDLKTLE